jgi:hypothetical protein
VHFPAGDLGIGFTEQTLQHLLRTRVTEEPLLLPLGGVLEAETFRASVQKKGPFT